MSWQTLSDLLDVFTCYFFCEEWESYFFEMNKPRVDFFLTVAGEELMPLPVSPDAFTWWSLIIQEE